MGTLRTRRDLYLSVFVMGLFARQHLMPLVILGLNMSLWTWSEIVSFDYYLQSAHLQINCVSCFINECSDFRVGFLFHIIHFSFVFMQLQIPSWSCNQAKLHKLRNRLSHSPELGLCLLNKDAYSWAVFMRNRHAWENHKNLSSTGSEACYVSHCTYGAWCYYKREIKISSHVFCVVLYSI